MLLKAIADLALEDIEKQGNDMRHAISNAVYEIGEIKDMTNDEIIRKIKEECITGGK
ncbi:hypothetical protein SDC9_141384 [bioreactor metagenome]|uniref:Uncharacterized protein n=1 Tax=bioreactor metagenome TaxID=1076179 RepID=A0A645DY95_9ZZZZ